MLKVDRLQQLEAKYDDQWSQQESQLQHLVILDQFIPFTSHIPISKLLLNSPSFASSILYLLAIML